MSSDIYLGVRVELATRFYTINNLPARYNRKYKQTRVTDVNKNGKIAVEKTRTMLIARGEKQPKERETGLVNFSVGIWMGDNQQDAERVVQIVNVLGNNKLIKERVKTFVDEKSTLNSIPELSRLRDAFVNLEQMMPGFISAGWYYAPEIIEK